KTGERANTGENARKLAKMCEVSENEGKLAKTRESWRKRGKAGENARKLAKTRES
nr:hypothetical protein [Tanacetum cinerariifolium]